MSSYPDTFQFAQKNSEKFRKKERKKRKSSDDVCVIISSSDDDIIVEHEPNDFSILRNALPHSQSSGSTSGKKRNATPGGKRKENDSKSTTCADGELCQKCGGIKQSPSVPSTVAHEEPTTTVSFVSQKKRPSLSLNTNSGGQSVAVQDSTPRLRLGYREKNRGSKTLPRNDTSLLERNRMRKNTPLSEDDSEDDDIIIIRPQDDNLMANDDITIIEPQNDNSMTNKYEAKEIRSEELLASPSVSDGESTIKRKSEQPYPRTKRKGEQPCLEDVECITPDSIESAENKNVRSSDDRVKKFRKKKKKHELQQSETFIGQDCVEIDSENDEQLQNKSFENSKKKEKKKKPEEVKLLSQDEEDFADLNSSEKLPRQREMNGSDGQVAGDVNLTRKKKKVKDGMSASHTTQSDFCQNFSSFLRENSEENEGLRRKVKKKKSRKENVGCQDVDCVTVPASVERAEEEGKLKENHEENRGKEFQERMGRLRKEFPVLRNRNRLNIEYDAPTLLKKGIDCFLLNDSCNDDTEDNENPCQLKCSENIKNNTFQNATPLEPSKFNNSLVHKSCEENVENENMLQRKHRQDEKERSRKCESSGTSTPEIQCLDVDSSKVMMIDSESELKSDAQSRFTRKTQVLHDNQNNEKEKQSGERKASNVRKPPKQTSEALKQNELLVDSSDEYVPEIGPDSLDKCNFKESSEENHEENRDKEFLEQMERVRMKFSVSRNRNWLNLEYDPATLLEKGIDCFLLNDSCDDNTEDATSLEPFKFNNLLVHKSCEKYVRNKNKLPRKSRQDKKEKSRKCESNGTSTPEILCLDVDSSKVMNDSESELKSDAQCRFTKKNHVLRDNQDNEKEKQPTVVLRGECTANNVRKTPKQTSKASKQKSELLVDSIFEDSSDEIVPEIGPDSLDKCSIKKSYKNNCKRNLQREELCKEESDFNLFHNKVVNNLKSNFPSLQGPTRLGTDTTSSFANDSVDVKDSSLDIHPAELRSRKRRKKKRGTAKCMGGELNSKYGGMDKTPSELLVQCEHVPSSGASQVLEAYKEKMKNLYIHLEHDVPLAHIIEQNPFSKPTKDEEELLKQQQVKSCKFSNTEILILKENWRRFCKEFGFEDGVLFSMTSAHMNECARRQFLRYLGQGLEAHSLYMIHKTFVHLCWDDAPFKKEEDKLIRTIITVGCSTPYTILSKLLNRSRRSIIHRWRQLQGDAVPGVKSCPLSKKSHPLNLQLKEALLKALVKVQNCKVEDLKNETFSRHVWKAVAKELQITQFKARNTWDELHCALFSESPMSSGRISQIIIEWLHELQPEFLKDVPWILCADRIPGYTASFIRKQFLELKQQFHSSEFSSFSEFVNYLHENQLELLGLVSPVCFPRYRVNPDLSLSLMNGSANEGMVEET